MSEQLLVEIRELLRCLVKLTSREIIQQELLEPQVKKVYELTGIKGQSQIAEKTGVSAGKISGLWQKWENMGLLLKDGKKYRKV